MSVTFTRTDGIARVMLDRPPVNALDLDIVERLCAVFDELAKDPPLGLILAGAGRCVSAGVDTKAFAAYDRATRARFILALSPMVTTLYGLPFPVVCAVGGHAMGGGFMLMLCGDVRVAAGTPDILLGLTEAKAGVPFPAGPLEIVASELPPELLRSMTLTSATFPPSDIHRLGVIDELVAPENLMSTAEARVRAMAAQSGFALVKAQIRQPALARLSKIVESGTDPMIAALGACGVRPLQTFTRG